MNPTWRVLTLIAGTIALGVFTFGCFYIARKRSKGTAVELDFYLMTAWYLGIAIAFWWLGLSI